MHYPKKENGHRGFIGIIMEKDEKRKKLLTIK